MDAPAKKSTEGGLTPLTANGAAIERQKVSQALGELVCAAAATRFHPSIVAAAWGRACADLELAAALAELDEVEAADAVAAAQSGRRKHKGGSAPGAREKRPMTPFMLAITLATERAKADPEVVALLKRLPGPKQPDKGPAGELLPPKLVVPVTDRTTAWRNIPEATKEALLVPYTSFCAAEMQALTAAQVSHAEIQAALAKHCKAVLKQPLPDVYSHYKPQLIAVLRTRLSNSTAHAVASGAAGAAAGPSTVAGSQGSKPRAADGAAAAAAAVQAAAADGKGSTKHKHERKEGRDKSSKKHKKLREQ